MALIIIGGKSLVEKNLLFKGDYTLKYVPEMIIAGIKNLNRE